jgi:hypothetical protein
MKRGGPAAQGGGISNPNPVGQRPLKRIDLGPERRDPIRIESRQ